MSAMKRLLENIADRIASKVGLDYEDVMDVYDIFTPDSEEEWTRDAQFVADMKNGKYSWVRREKQYA